jgi:hypothetical protein
MASSNLFVHGGWNQTGLLSDLYVFQVFSHTWSKPAVLGDVLPGRLGGMLHAFDSNRIIAFGGANAVNDEAILSPNMHQIIFEAEHTRACAKDCKSGDQLSWGFASPLPSPLLNRKFTFTPLATDAFRGSMFHSRLEEALCQFAKPSTGVGAKRPRSPSTSKPTWVPGVLSASNCVLAYDGGAAIYMLQLVEEKLLPKVPLADLPQVRALMRSSNTLPEKRGEERIRDHREREEDDTGAKDARIEGRRKETTALKANPRTDAANMGTSNRTSTTSSRSVSTLPAQLDDADGAEPFAASKRSRTDIPRSSVTHEAYTGAGTMLNNGHTGAGTMVHHAAHPRTPEDTGRRSKEAVDDISKAVGDALKAHIAEIFDALPLPDAAEIAHVVRQTVNNLLSEHFRQSDASHAALEHQFDSTTTAISRLETVAATTRAVCDDTNHLVRDVLAQGNRGRGDDTSVMQHLLKELVGVKAAVQDIQHAAHEQSAGRETYAVLQEKCNELIRDKQLAALQLEHLHTECGVMREEARAMRKQLIEAEARSIAAEDLERMHSSRIQELENQLMNAQRDASRANERLASEITRREAIEAHLNDVSSSMSRWIKR